MHTADIFFSRALRDQQQVISFILHFSSWWGVYSFWWYRVLLYPPSYVALLNCLFPMFISFCTSPSKNLCWTLSNLSFFVHYKCIFLDILAWFYISFCFSQVLWISDNGIPDLGGINDEVSSFMDEVNFNISTSYNNICFLYSLTDYSRELVFWCFSWPHFYAILCFMKAGESTSSYLSWCI